MTTDHRLKTTDIVHRILSIANFSFSLLERAGVRLFFSSLSRGWFCFCEMAGFLAFARQRVFPGGGPSDVCGALHAEGNYSSGHCSGFAPDSLSTRILCLPL